MSFTIGSTIYTKLAADATLTGYVGTSPVRIFPDVAPLNVAQTFPYIVYSIISQVPTNTKGPTDPGQPADGGPQTERSPLDIVRIQISSFSNNYSESVVVADRIRTLLDRAIGSGFAVGSGPTIDSIIYDGMSSNYESKIKPQGVYEFSQEYIVRIINTEIAPTYTNTYSLNFDGVDDYMTVGDQSIFSFGNGVTDSPFSISCWVYLRDNSNEVIWGKSASAGVQEYHLLIDSGGKLRFRLYDNTTGGYIQAKLNNAGDLVINTWYNITATYDGSGAETGIKIYLDSVLTAQTQSDSVPVYTAMDDTAAALTFATTGYPSNFAEASIDEISMFNIELTAAQTLSIYNAGAPKSEASHTGLIGYWRNGDSGVYPVINDQSSNSNNGTMINMISSDIETFTP